jgi:hypothetical protein
MVAGTFLSATAANRRADAVGVGRLPAAIAVAGFRSTENREDRRGVARGVEVFEVEAVIPGLFHVEPLKLLRAHLELDRDHALLCHEHRIDPPAEPRDVELEVDPRGWGGGGGDIHSSRQIGEGRTEHGQLQVPRGELLGGERVALGGGERRVGLRVARGEKLAHGSGVEGGVEARA